MFKKILIANCGYVSPSPSGEGLGWGLSTGGALADTSHPAAPSPEGEGA